MKKYNLLLQHTNEVAYYWRKHSGVAPADTAEKLDRAMLEWQLELTQTLKLWIDKGLSMTTGELILARANLGALVESWLKFFYTVYYEDYRKDPAAPTRNSNVIEPEKASFEQLKVFSRGTLLDPNDSVTYAWIGSVQYKRNAIHSFTYRDIGTPEDLKCPPLSRHEISIDPNSSFH